MTETPEQVWQGVQETFALFGKKLGPLRGERRKLLTRMLNEGYTPLELRAAIHGYAWLHNGLTQTEDEFDPKRYFTPETIWRLSKIDLRIDEAMQRGPYKRPAIDPKKPKGLAYVEWKGHAPETPLRLVSGGGDE